MKSIIIIIPYFGELPSLFPFWLQSALNNPSIDFLLVTDANIRQHDNIKVLQTNFESLKNRIQQLFDFKISLETPYKLCDFKPAYGIIFEKEVLNYNFWGFGDIDLIYGNIRSFINDTILNNYDVISGWGHLTLYKNCKECNTFFKKDIRGYTNYKTAFSTQHNLAFDEYLHLGMGDLWKHLYPEKVWDSRLFDDIRIPEKSFNFISEFHPEYSNSLIFLYEQEQLYRIYISENKLVKEPTLYAHFQRRKFIKIKTYNTSKYIIIPNQIIDYEDINKDKCLRWGKPQPFKQKIWKFKKRITQLLSKGIR